MTDCFLVVMLGIYHQKTKDQQRIFDERIINCTYTIQEHLLGIAVCLLIMLKNYPQSLTNADILGQGNLNLVSEKSGKSQGILLSIICGNPALVSTYQVRLMTLASTVFKKSTFQKISHLNTLGRKFDLDVK